MAFAGWVEFRQDEDGPLVLLGGDIDIDVATEIQDITIEENHRQGRPFTVDVSWVSFLDSAGLALLLRLYNCERSLIVTGEVPENVRRIVAMTGLAEILGIQTSDESDAGTASA